MLTRCSYGIRLAFGIENQRTKCVKMFQSNCIDFSPTTTMYYAYSTIKAPDRGEVGGSSPPRPTINPQCLCGYSRFCLSPEFPAKPFVNDLSTSRIAMCRPRRHRRHHELARGFTDCLNFLLTATAPRHSRNGKEHKRSFPAYWIVEVLPPKPAFTDSRGNRHRHLRYLDHSPPYQGRVACRQSSVLVFEWELSGNGAPLTKT
jgi:hypothetical protein